MIGLFLVSIPVCFAIGSLIGLLCRGNILKEICFSLLSSGLYFAFLEWKLGDSDEWSPNYPFVSALYLFGPFMFLFFTPTVGASLLTGYWRLRSSRSINKQ